MVLKKADRDALVRALTAPPAPAPRLVEAFRRTRAKYRNAFRALAMG